MTTIPAASRGVLHPDRLPEFHRMTVVPELEPFVRWFWIPEWNIEPGRTSRQHVVGFPACNLVVEPTMVGVAGPNTRATYRDLTGAGWAVGALLRPAAVPALVGNASALRDSFAELDHPRLLADVRDAMQTDAPARDRRQLAVSVFTAWLSDRLEAPGKEALLANRIVEVAEADPTVVSVTDLAVRVHVSTRTLQRVAATHVGLSPAALIRRRRLHEAAERLRADPGLDLASLAHDLGYADHAHLAHDFRVTLGFTPSSYRSASAVAAAAP